MEVLIFFGLVALGFAAGSVAEKNHLASLQAREQDFLKLPVSNLKHVPESTREIAAAELVTGSAVIAVDYFKICVAALVNLVGGRITVYESLVERARREATLRLKAQAQALGADLIVNLRIETANLSEGGGSGTPNIEALAYGTAIRYRH